MAVSVDHGANGSKEGDVSNCVSNLMHAFTNGLDIFKRFRERRRKRKTRKQQSQSDQPSDAELQLSNSLRQGPQDLQSSYVKHYSKAGDRFAKGDAIAHASLAETLIKLNTGLVGIIAAFLNHDSKSNHIDLDYKSLTSLSEISRAEALTSMDQLYSRLSRSQLNVHRLAGCSHCGSTKHRNCSGIVKDPVTAALADSVVRKAAKKINDAEQASRAGTQSDIVRRTGTPRSRSTTPIVTRIPVKGSKNQTQLVAVRPRNPRKGSSSSSSSGSSRSTTPATSSVHSSPLASPLPQYTPMDPFPPPALQPSEAFPSFGRRAPGLILEDRPSTWPTDVLDAASYPFTPLPAFNPPGPHPRNTSHPQRRAKGPSSPPPVQSPVRRRLDKPTPSQYTFASDSTKIGEIPERDWVRPWNAAEAERMNAEAAVVGYPQPMETAARPKKGLFGFLRRGSNA